MFLNEARFSVCATCLSVTHRALCPAWIHALKQIFETDIKTQQSKSLAWQWAQKMELCSHFCMYKLGQ